MGREEDCAVVETPRRRVKRDRVAATKYDPDMYDPVSRVPPMYHEEEFTTSGTKRKRAKKTRGDDDDDDWVPDRIAPPPPRSARIHEGRNDDSAQLHPQQQQYQYNYAPTTASMSTSLFHDTPVVIQSFTEITERRRNNAASSSNSSSLKVNTQEREFDRNGLPVRFPLSSTTSTQGQSTRSLAQATMTVMDLFYPNISTSRALRKDLKSIKQEESTTPPNNGARESKRRRRGDISTTRSSRSRNVQEDGNDHIVYDMLQFGVDSVKLIPQGLVDRIDPQMRGKFVTNIIINHVENWSKRAGFGGVLNNFVHELATLLTAYYPCTHPTLLDEVLSSFVFKRPELLAPLLRPMIDKMVKIGEKATPSKYPIIQSFARKCNPQGISTSEGGYARHNLACLTLLQCLVEQNIEGFCLTPWIVVCATSCTRKVREMFWENMIRSISEKRVIDSSSKWQIFNPLDHISEILTIERQDNCLDRASDCSLAVTLIWTLLCHTDLDVGTEITSEAFKSVFGYGRVHTCAKLLYEWLGMIRVVGADDDSTTAWTTILNTIITNCSQLSVAESSWFVVRVLHSIINQPCVPTATVKMLLLHHASLFLGDADPRDLDELVRWQQSQSSPTVNICGIERATTSDVYKGELTTLQLRVLIDQLQTEENGEKFLDIWSEAWGNDTSVVLVPWCYVWAIISFCVLKIKIVRETPIDKRFAKFAEQVCDQHFDCLLSGDQEPRKSTISVRITQMFELIRTRTNPFAHSLLVRMLHKCCSRFLATRALFSNVVISNLASSHSQNVTANAGELNMIFRVATLTTLAELARDDTIGDYVHSILLSRPLFHVINTVISSGDDEEVALILDALTNAIDRQDPKPYAIDSCVVELLVVCMYRRGQHIARKAGLLLEAIAYKSPSFGVTALWCLLQVSGNYCCGCKQEVGIRSSNTKEVVVMCADLFQSIWMSLGSDSMAKLVVEILAYVQHRMVSCTFNGLGWNIFLVQVLLRLIQCGYGEKSPSIIRFVASAFEREGGSLEDESLQLEILHAFCTELRSVWPDKSPDWSIAVSIVCSAQVRHRLRKLATQSTCATSATLAKMILHSSKELRMLKRTQVDTVNVIDTKVLPCIS